MKPCLGYTIDSVLLESDGKKDIKKIIDKNSAQFIDFIHKIGLNVVHDSVTKNSKNTSTTIMTLKTTCFKVDINQNFAKITALN